MSSAEELRAHKDERKEEVAEEKYGKHYEDLTGREKQSVAGTVGNEIRREQMTEEGGGDTHQPAHDTRSHHKQQQQHASAEELRANKDERKEEVAEEKYGKPYEELSTREKQSVAGTVGGEIRREQMTEAAGGDTHAAYQEMRGMRHDAQE